MLDPAPFEAPSGLCGWVLTCLGDRTRRCIGRVLMRVGGSLVGWGCLLDRRSLGDAAERRMLREVLLAAKLLDGRRNGG